MSLCSLHCSQFQKHKSNWVIPLFEVIQWIIITIWREFKNLTTLPFTKSLLCIYPSCTPKTAILGYPVHFPVTSQSLCPPCVEFSWGRCTSSVPLTDHLASSTSPCRTHSGIYHLWGVFCPISPSSVHTLPWSCIVVLKLQRVIIMICVWAYSTGRSLNTKTILCIYSVPNL